MRSRNLTIFAHIDHGGEAKRVGLAMQEAHVLIFGNPKGGTPLMIASLILALDLPLKILIWQNEDPRVWISYTSIAFLRDSYGIRQDLAGYLSIIEVVIEQA